MENGEGSEETKMAPAAGLTNGHVTSNGSAEAPPSVASGGTTGEVGGEVVIRSKPQVTESVRSSENIGENSSDVERFKSKMTEFTDTGKSSVANEKQYEENALKAMRERTDDSEMTSTSETRLAQRDRVETTDSGETKSHYSENQDKKHETTSQSVEKAGDMTAKMSKSDSSHQKSAVSVDASSDGHHAVLVDIGNDSSSKTLEEIEGAGFKGTRRVESSKSERQMEYTSHSGGGVPGGDGGPGGPDLSLQFDELFGKGRGDDRGKRNVSFLDGYDGVGGGKDRIGGAGGHLDELDFLNQDYRKRPGERGGGSGGGGYGSRDMIPEEDEFTSGYSSRRTARQQHQQQEYMDEQEFGSRSKQPWGLSTDRRTADDLVQRILNESRGGSSSRSTKGSKSFDYDSRPYSPSTRSFSPSSQPFSPSSKYGSRSFDDEAPYSPSAGPKKENIFKVDMGDGGHLNKAHPNAQTIRHEDEDELALQEYQPRRKAQPQPAEEMSLLDRRLASMGFDTKLGQQMYVKKDAGANEGFVETTYISKKKPPSTFLGEQDDDLDDEINALRNSFQQSLQRRQRLVNDDFDDEESQSSGGGHAVSSNAGAISSYRASTRGRMVRQNYIDDSESYGGYNPRVGAESPLPEDLIPDDDFVPKKRPETEEIVKEKTTNIRGVIEKQSSVLEKLREASTSFDDLSSEIKTIKQQFMENQLKRQSIMQDDFDGPDDGGPRGYYPGSMYGTVLGPAQEDGYRPYIPRSKRMEMQRSQSMYDDMYSSTNTYRGGRDMNTEVQRMPRAGAQRGMEEEDYGDYQPRHRDQMMMSPGEREPYDYQPRHRDQMMSPGGHAPYGEEDEDDALGYGAQPGRRSYDTSNINQYSEASSSSRYFTRPTFNRANTVSDFNFERPSSPGYVRHDRYDRPSTFSSRFLDRVREKKASGISTGQSPLATDTASGSTRDKPFKSRFLRDSFNSGATSTSSFSSKSTSFSSSSSTTTSSVKMEPSATVSIPTTTSNSDSPVSAAAPPPSETKSDSSAPTESTATTE